MASGGIFKPAQLLQHHAPVVVDLGHIRPQRQRLVHQGQRLRGLAGLGQRYATQLPGHGIARLVGQHLGIERIGLGQLALLVQGDGLA